jgi:hypothetical protein
MTRIVILGGPRTGKTTLANKMAPLDAIVPAGFGLVRHTDDLIGLGWSEGSQHIADEWLTQPGPWIIEGVACSRALRKWREAHAGEPPPVDRVIRLTTPHVALEGGQIAMMKGEHTVWSRDVEPWLRDHGVEIEHP